MKVLFINTVYGKGSTGRIIKEIGAVLERNGHSFMVAYGRGPAGDDGHEYRIGSTASVYAHAFLSRLTDRTGFYSVTATKRLVRFIRDYAPDVINLHNLHGYYINVQILFDYLKNEYKGKILWTLHDCWAFTGHCVHYTYAKCEKWKTGCYHCPEKCRYPKTSVVDNSTHNYSVKKNLFTGMSNMTIATPSAWLKSEVSQSFLREYSCYVINNGIDLDAFSPQNVKKDNKLLLNIADGLDDRKGFHDLIKLMEILPEDYQMVMVGVQKKDLKKIPKIITPVQRTNSVAELAGYYSRAGWFINTTYEDTFPTVNIEALACGTPVITYRSGGSPEVLTENTGVVVEPGDVKALAQAIVSQNNYCQESCVKQAQDYDKWKKFQKYVELYEQLLKE